MSKLMNFPQDWLNAFSSDDKNTEDKQIQFETLIQSFIDLEKIDLSKYVDRKALVYNDDDFKLFAFAIFGCSRGAFNLNEFLINAEALDQLIDKLSFANDELDLLRSKNPLLVQIISLAEIISCDITD